MATGGAKDGGTPRRRKPPVKPPAPKSRRSPQSMKSKAKRATNRAKAKGGAVTPEQVSKAKAGTHVGTKGRRKGMSVAIQALRDQLMIQRVAEGWTMEAIAQEADMTPRGARAAITKRLADAPLQLNTDPVAVVESVFEGYQLSVGSFEALALAALTGENHSAAVSAKKGANEARERLIDLLQRTGRLPQELGALRHLMDLRAIAVRMLDAVEEFDRTIEALELEGEEAEIVADAAARLREVFEVATGTVEDPDADEEIVDADVVPKEVAA